MSTEHTGPYAAIDESFENATGVDLRLVYGIGVPFVLGVGAIVAFALINQLWLAFVLLFAIIVAGGLVLHGISRMLADEEGEDG